MDTDTLIQAIAQKDADIFSFARLAITDSSARDEIVRLMVSHRHIMVYYHCFYTIDQASQVEPALFYPYWESIAALLEHKNSYHRCFALTILGNLTAVDSDNRIEPLLPAYLARLDDEKLMTALCCARNCAKIIRHKPGLTQQVIAHLLSLDTHCRFTHKQGELLKADVLAVIEATCPERPIPEPEAAFIRSASRSSSPKTRKRAKSLVAKYGL